MLRYSTKALMLLPLVAAGWCAGSVVAGGPTKPVTDKSVIRQVKQTAAAVPSNDQELQTAPDPGTSLVEDQQQMTRLQTEKLRNEVSRAIESAHASDDPAVGLAALKQTLGSVKAAIDIGPEDRLRMQKQLESTIQQPTTDAASPVTAGCATRSSTGRTGRPSCGTRIRAAPPP